MIETISRIAGQPYKAAGCVLLLGAILHDMLPDEELYPRLKIQLEGAMTLDRLDAELAHNIQQLQLNLEFYPES